MFTCWRKVLDRHLCKQFYVHPLPFLLSILNLARRPLPVVRLDFYRYVKINENNSRGIESFFSRSNQFCYFILIISVYIYIYT